MQPENKGDANNFLLSWEDPAGKVLTDEMVLELKKKRKNYLDKEGAVKYYLDINRSKWKHLHCS